VQGHEGNDQAFNTFVLQLGLLKVVHHVRTRIQGRDCDEEGCNKSFWEIDGSKNMMLLYVPVVLHFDNTVSYLWSRKNRDK
jgi:hypothetical protein